VAASSLTHYVPVVGVTSSIDWCVIDLISQRARGMASLTLFLSHCLRRSFMDNEHVPTECQNAYWIWLAIVAALVVPASCMDLTGQVRVPVWCSLALGNALTSSLSACV
jgi:hypothetical protein